MKYLVRVIRWVGALLVILAAIIAAAWTFGAVWFDAPFGAAANRIAAALFATAFVVVLLVSRTIVHAGRGPSVANVRTVGTLAAFVVCFAFALVPFAVLEKAL